MTHELLERPLWRPDDLGKPIPNTPHAVSVCLPTWRDNVGYEEQEPRVVEKLSTGYPRFVYNRFCRELFAACASRFASDDETCLAFPSASAAERCVKFLRDRTGDPAFLHEFGLHNVWAVRFARRHADIAKTYWQHCGDGVSSRLAAACLTGQTGTPAADAKDAIRNRVARLAGVAPGDVFLFPCGMSAIFCLHRVLTGLNPNRKTVQFGFPYVDTLKIQEKFGPGVHFFPKGDAADATALEALLASENIGGLYTEFPSNPLLVSPDLERLVRMARQHEFPLIVDDTVASFFNADFLSVADVVCSSLTKYFSGVGDVTGGALLLNRRSPFHADLLSLLRREWEDLVWGADAVVLEQNSRDFEERLPRINSGAERLADHLHAHRKVAEVFYPKFQTLALYRQFLKPHAGFGGLLSIVLDDAPSAAPRFFDALTVSKGPNLGTNYTLACPYTILAHYRELDFAESCGVSRYLIRVAVGLEDPDDLIQRFESALSAT